MTSDKRVRGTLVAGLLLFLFLAGACSAPTPAERQAATPTLEPVATPADRWSALLTEKPYPYLLSLSREAPSAIDGTYTKVEPATERVHCLRCPDYAPDGGVWKLNLDQGVFRIMHEDTGWTSVGSFAVTQDRVSKVKFPDKLLLFNDPYCPDIVGVYTWELEEGGLVLAEVDDTCSYRLRAANLSSKPWLSCLPPNEEAAVTDHWPKPAGCD